jgi:hypothetical protein|eukprot:COSAG06_NODE_3699_length_4996_cov_4.274658_2_plen_260_part_00
MARNVDAHRKAISAIALKIIRDSMLEIGRPAAKRKKPEPKRKNNEVSKPRKRPAVAAAAVAEPKPLLEKMVAATCAGEAGEPSKADTRQLLALLREGKAEARCSFSEEDSDMSSNATGLEVDGFFTVGSSRYSFSGTVTDEDGDKILSNTADVEGLGYFCEDDATGAQCGRRALGNSNDALKWAALAGVEMTEGQVIRIVATGLSVMLGSRHGHQVGDAKDESYGFDPVGWIFDWVGEAACEKFSNSSADSSADSGDGY